MFWNSNKFTFAIEEQSKTYLTNCQITICMSIWRKKKKDRSRFQVSSLELERPWATISGKIVTRSRGIPFNRAWPWCIIHFYIFAYLPASGTSNLEIEQRYIGWHAVCEYGSWYYALVYSYYRHVTDTRLFWGLMKIEIRSATISSSKNKTKCVFSHKFRRRIDVIICNTFSSL